MYRVQYQYSSVLPQLVWGPAWSVVGRIFVDNNCSDSMLGKIAIERVFGRRS
jgi:hypothetical protein